jgi:hypothetical protein
MKTQIVNLYLMTMLLFFASAIANAENTSSTTNDGKKSVTTAINNLNNKKAYTIKIFDSRGYIVFQESDAQLNNNESQFLGNLSAGYYTYQVIHGNEMVYRAIISTNGETGTAIGQLPGKASASIAQKDEMVLVRLLKESDSRARVVIRDESNQIVFSKRTAKDSCQNITYDFSKLPQGRYYVDVLSKGVLVAQKLIVKDR